jgi:ATP-dependent Clp protease ATP-binding subunit ClpA
VANLTTASRDTIATLERRSREACVVYPRHPLPDGCLPDHADIGIETSGDETLLHIRRGIEFTGPEDPEIAEWVATGTRRFETFGDCVAWLRQKLGAPSQARGEPRASAGRQARPGRSAPKRPPVRRLPVEQVTELEQVEIQSKPAPTPAELGQVLSAQVLGQDAAINGLVELAAHHLAKPYPRRPASALLIGATGTGKTLAAEQLAEHLTETSGAQWSYERLDMSEFSERHSVSRLFGAPPGYIGYDDGHDLASALRNNPKTVILLDEMDKAHPQLWRSIMNLMDAGRIGGQAREIDARQAILLFTSNKDAAAVQPLADASDQRLRRFLRDHGYPPEIVGRLGRVLVFKPLSPAVTAQLIVLTVQRIVESYGLLLDRIAPDAVADLANRAPLQSGGRDVEYFIERELGGKLAEALREIPPEASGAGVRAAIDEGLEVTLHAEASPTA